MLCERQDFLLLSTDLPDYPDAERRTKIIIYDHLRSLLKPPLSRETYFWSLLVGLSGIVINIFIPSKGFKCRSLNFRLFWNPQWATISVNVRGSLQKSRIISSTDLPGWLVPWLVPWLICGDIKDLGGVWTLTRKAVILCEHQRFFNHWWPWFSWCWDRVAKKSVKILFISR